MDAAMRAARDVDEPALVARLRAGDDEAYAWLVRTYSPRLLAVARRMLRNDAEAAEALQDGFISAFKAIGSFAGDAQLSTWLHRIVVNAALMRLRSKGRRQEDSIEDLLPQFLEDGHQVAASQPWPASSQELVEQRETRELVRGCIDRLPESYRTVLLLRDIEELDTQEAAKALGVNENIVKIRLHRARQALRTLLDEHFTGTRA